MFKFGFSLDDTETEADEGTEEKFVEWHESKEIVPDDDESIIPDNFNVKSIQCGEYNIKYVSDEEVLRKLNTKDEHANSTLLNAEQNHSDLITAVYEGGLKIWECTFDLLHFIQTEGIDLSDKKVLDLGCGIGIIGIFACLKGSKTVFQDYVKQINSEVIKSATIHNVCLNNINPDRCSFYCGDWQSFLHLQKKTSTEKFDYIFTSETIYNVDNYRKILNIFKELLQKTGIIYLAAKCHYFGVGGGVAQFEDMLKQEDIFDHSICWVCSDGVKRAIIKITLKYLRC